jgi:hypothetical protein
MNAPHLFRYCLLLVIATGLLSSNAVAQVPVVDAGYPVFVQLPANQGTLQGVVTNATTTTWAFVSGPVTPGLTTPNQPSTQVTGLTAVGTYTFRLTATNAAGSANATTTISVIRPQIILAITAQARVVLPQNQVALGASARVNGGTITSYAWTQTNGPSPASLTGANTANAVASNLERGSYTFQVAVTDNLGGSASQQVVVSVVHDLAVTGLRLTSANLDSDLGRVVDGTVINYQNTPANNLNLRPVTNGAVASLRFVLYEGQTELLQKVVQSAPFALLQGEAWPSLPAGNYTVAITPFAGPNLSGSQGQTLIVRFGVTATGSGRLEVGE